MNDAKPAEAPATDAAEPKDWSWLNHWSVLQLELASVFLEDSPLPTEVFQITVLASKRPGAPTALIEPENDAEDVESFFERLVHCRLARDVDCTLRLHDEGRSRSLLDAVVDDVMAEVCASFDALLEAALGEIDRNASGTIELDELLAHFLARGRGFESIMTEWRTLLDRKSAALKALHEPPAPSPKAKRDAGALLRAAGAAVLVSNAGKPAPLVKLDRRRAERRDVKVHSPTLLRWMLSAQVRPLDPACELAHLVYQWGGAEAWPRLWTGDVGDAFYSDEGINLPVDSEGRIELLLPDGTAGEEVGRVDALSQMTKRDVAVVRDAAKAARKAAEGARDLHAKARSDAGNQATPEVLAARTALDEALMHAKHEERRLLEEGRKAHAGRVRFGEAVRVHEAADFQWVTKPRLDGGEGGGEVPALRAIVKWTTRAYGPSGRPETRHHSKPMWLLPRRWCPAPGTRLRLTPSADAPFAATIAEVKPIFDAPPRSPYTVALTCTIDNGGGSATLLIAPSAEAGAIIDTTARGFVTVRHDERDLPAELELPVWRTGVQAHETQRRIADAESIARGEAPAADGASQLLVSVGTGPHAKLCEMAVLRPPTDRLRPTCYYLQPLHAPAEGGAEGGAADADGVSLDLNGFNHAALRGRTAEGYREAVRSWCASLAVETSHMEDGITGNRLPTDHVITLRTASRGMPREGFSDVPDMKSLAAPLTARTPERAHGSHPAQPVLLQAGPGTGKTWSSVQLARELALTCGARAAEDGGVLQVPVLIHVQRLSRMLHTQPASLPIDGGVLMQYFVRELANHEKRAEWLDMLAQAYELRALVCVVDGIDEAAGRQATISRYLRELLVPMGIRLVCTSRPEGIVTADFAMSRFVVLDLLTLSEEQQRDVSAKQLGPHGRAFSRHLLAFAAIRQEHDTLFEHTAFPDETERERIEWFATPNKLMRDEKRRIRDERMRQRAKDGGFVRVAEAVASAGDGAWAEKRIKSAHVRALSAMLSQRWLLSVDEQLDSEAVQASLGSDGRSSGDATEQALAKALDLCEATERKLNKFGRALAASPRFGLAASPNPAQALSTATTPQTSPRTPEASAKVALAALTARAPATPAVAAVKAPPLSARPALSDAPPDARRASAVPEPRRGSAAAAAFAKPPKSLAALLQSDKSTRFIAKEVKVARSKREIEEASMRKRRRELSMRLALLVLKRRADLADASAPCHAALVHASGRGGEQQAGVPTTTCLGLWASIVARTDLLYEAIEDVQTVAIDVMLAAGRKVGLTRSDFEVAPGLKDPIRVHEKALDDYLADFLDWDDAVVIPEACVLDMIRARAVCPTGTVMLRLLEELKRGFTCLIKGRCGLMPVALWLARCKNKVRDHDPTHFRNMLCNCVLEFDGRRTFIELQVHHEAIYAFNEDAHAHEHYEYFRERLGARYGLLDAMLERMLIFLEEASGVPVLFSMLVLVFKHIESRAEGGGALNLPTDRNAMYETAIAHTLHGKIGKAILDMQTAREQREQRQLAKRKEVLSLMTMGAQETPRALPTDAPLSGDVVVELANVEGEPPAERMEEAGGAAADDAATKADDDAEVKDVGGMGGGGGDAVDADVAGAATEAEAAAPDAAAVNEARVRWQQAGEQVVQEAASAPAAAPFAVEPSVPLDDARVDKLAQRALVMLRRIAAANHLHGHRRTFSSRDAKEALLLPVARADPKAWKLWRWLHLQNGGCPLVRTLEDGKSFEEDDGKGGGEAKGGSYQFMHLSFQEALCGQQAIHGDLSLRDTFWGNDRKAASFLNNANNLNMCRISAGALGSAFAKLRGVWDFSASAASLHPGPETHAVAALAQLLRHNDTLTHLDLSNHFLGSFLQRDDPDGRTRVQEGVDDAAAPTPIAMLVHGLLENDVLVSLVLDDCDLGVHGVTVLANVLLDNRSIAKLSLAGNALCGARVMHGGVVAGEYVISGLRMLLQALKTSMVSNLCLSRNLLGNDGFAEIAAALAEATSIRTLGLSATHPQTMLTFTHRDGTVRVPGPAVGPANPAAHPASPSGSRPGSPDRSRPNSPNRSLAGSREPSRPSSRNPSRPSTPPPQPFAPSSDATSPRAPRTPMGPRDQRYEKQFLFDVKLFALSSGLLTEPTLDAHPSAIHTRRGFALLTAALRTNRNVTSLDLSHNMLGDANAQVFAQIFTSRKLRITELFFDGNALEGPPRDLVRLAKLQYVEDPFPRYL